MEEIERAFWFGAVLWSIVVSALVLYGMLSNHIGELQDENPAASRRHPVSRRAWRVRQRAAAVGDAE